MNQSKARDFYSAYYEGTLDFGLTQAFERALTTEAEVKAEYEQFVRVMEDLKVCKPLVEPPEDLHLKIRERVLATQLAAERVVPSNLPVNHRLRERCSTLALREGKHLSRERARIVHNAAPDLARLPPALVCGVGPETEQDGNCGAQKPRNRNGDGR